MREVNGCQVRHFVTWFWGKQVAGLWVWFFKSNSFLLYWLLFKKKKEKGRKDVVLTIDFCLDGHRLIARGSKCKTGGGILRHLLFVGPISFSCVANVFWTGMAANVF